MYFGLLATRATTMMGVTEISRFLTFLAVDQQVSASTQNQALSALLFLYKHVLAMSIGDIPSA